MKRRDFLLLRTEAATRVAELSCERLYMHYQHAQVTTMPGASADTQASAVSGETEPATAFAERTTTQLFDEIARQVRGAHVVRIVDAEWLAVDGFRREVEGVLATFRGEGGRVERPDLVKEATR